MFFSELHICVYCGKDIPLTLSYKETLHIQSI